MNGGNGHFISGKLTGLVAICSDDGVRYIRIDASGDAVAQAGDNAPPASDDCTCTACTCCVTAGSCFAGMVPSPASGTALVVPTSQQLTAFMPGATPVAAEQYWALLRGPPDPKDKKSMTMMHARNAAPVACLAGFEGSISCL